MNELKLKLQTEALDNFRKKYPMATLGDLQSFTLGMLAQEEIQKEIEKRIEEFDPSEHINHDY